MNAAEPVGAGSLPHAWAAASSKPLSVTAPLSGEHPLELELVVLHAHETPPGHGTGCLPCGKQLSTPLPD